MRADTKRIREDYGTVKRFCKLKGVNYNTFKVWNSENGSSSRLDRIFRKYLVKKEGKRA